MRTLAAEAGVNLATVSYHFGGKAGLYQAILQEIIDIRDSIFPPSQKVLDRMTAAGDDIKAKAGVVDWFIETLIRKLLDRMDNVWPRSSFPGSLPTLPNSIPSSNRSSSTLVQSPVHPRGKNTTSRNGKG